MNIFQRITVFFVDLTSKIKWRQRSEITSEDRAKIFDMLKRDYYVIATRRRNFLSTFLIALGHFLLTRRWGYYSHVLMNTEDEVKSAEDFRLVEATFSGVHYSTFDSVFSGVDSVALLKPKSVTLDEWTAALDAAALTLGRPYDKLFDVMGEQAMSCVEVIRFAMRGLPNYNTNFANFERMVQRKENITPQSFYECPDFEVVWEVRR